MIITKEELIAPDLVKTVKVTPMLETQNWIGTGEDGETTAYMVPTAAYDFTDPSTETKWSLEKDEKGNIKYETEPFVTAHRINDHWVISGVSDIDITADVKARLANGEENIAYNMFNSNTEIQTCMFAVYSGNTYTFDITYYANDAIADVYNNAVDKASIINQIIELSKDEEGNATISMPTGWTAEAIAEKTPAVASYTELVNAIINPKAVVTISEVGATGAKITSDTALASCVVLAAGYKGNTLSEIVVTETTSLTEGENTVSYSFTATDYNSIRVFCWDSLESIKPLANSEEYTVDQ